MKITEKEVEYVAKLARLELAEGEKSRFREQLEKILGYIEQLNKLDTKNVPPTSHVLHITNVWREDEMKPCSTEQTEKILGNAPQREDNFLKVKKVIE